MHRDTLILLSCAVVQMLGLGFVAWQAVQVSLIAAEVAKLVATCCPR